MKRKLFIIWGLIGLMLGLASCGYRIDISEFRGKRGNTNSNINQSGFAAQDGEYIYFSVDSRLYEMDMRNEKIICLPNINPLFGYLNLVHPYVICSSEDPSVPGSSAYLTIHRLDGKYAKILDKKTYVPLLVVDEWVYASRGKDSPLYRIRIDGAEQSMLTDEIVSEFHVIGEWIYYSSGQKIRKMKIDGSEKDDVLPEATVGGYYIEPDMDTIFYRNLEDESKIYRASLSGESPSEKVLDYPCLYFQKVDDTIFFEDYQSDLYVVSLSERDSKPELIMGDINEFNILDDIILIKDSSDNIYMLDQELQLRMLEMPEVVD